MRNMKNAMEQGKGDPEDKLEDKNDSNLVDNPEKYPNNDVEKMLASKKSPMMYYVLMYTDGCTLIPQSWVNISERTYAWPTKPILSRSRMHELIPNKKWAVHKYVSHLGPYSTFADALEVEKICSNLSSTDDNDAIQNTVEKLLRSKKRITKTKDVYSDCSEQPPRKYIAQETKSSKKDINNQDTEARPPAGYIVSKPEKEIHVANDPYRFEAEYPQVSSNQEKYSDIDQPSTSGMKRQHKENTVSQNDLENALFHEYSGNKSFAGQKSRSDERKVPFSHNSETCSGKLVLVPVFRRNGNACYLQSLDSLLCKNEASGKWYAVQNVSDARNALNIEHQVRNIATGDVEKSFDLEAESFTEISVRSIPVCTHDDDVSESTSASKDDKVTDTDETNCSTGRSVSPSMLMMYLSRRRKSLKARVKKQE